VEALGLFIVVVSGCAAIVCIYLCGEFWKTSYDTLERAVVYLGLKFGLSG